MSITERLVYNSFLVFISIFLFSNGSDCSCVLQLSSKTQPLLFRYFGSKLIQLSHIKETDINLRENETIQASCAAGYLPIEIRNSDSYYSNRNLDWTNNKLPLNLNCKSDKIYVSTLIDNGYENNDAFKNVLVSTLGCRETTHSMYELRDELNNCSPYYSYALGSNLIPPIILAAICYDLEKLQLKYVSYKLREPSAVMEKNKLSYPKGLNSNSLGESLKSIEDFFSFQNNIKQRAANNFWLNIANYELDNIVQSNKLHRSIFNEFDKFFNIIWWHNLRIGNWRRFMVLLENHGPNEKYNIYTGTSHVVRIPATRKYFDEENLIINFENSQHPVPQFIWAYLESGIHNSTANNFVAIAYNSPYFEYFETNSTILCNDMCDEIHWLEPIQTSRLISTLGVFYCCRSEDVIGILDGFPFRANKNILNGE